MCLAVYLNSNTFKQFITFANIVNHLHIHTKSKSQLQSSSKIFISAHLIIDQNPINQEKLNLISNGGKIASQRSFCLPFYRRI